MEVYKSLSAGMNVLLEKAAELGWWCSEWIEKGQNDRTYVEMGKYSPAGEDFSMIIDFEPENQEETFLKNMRDYVNSFDVDEHVEMWVPKRGEGGCPSTIKELVEDAEAIVDMIKELYGELDNVPRPYEPDREGKDKKLAEFIIRNFHHCPIPVELVCEFGFGREGCIDCLLSHVDLLKLPRKD